MKRIFLAVVLLCVVLAGCAGGQPQQPQPQQPQPQQPQPQQQVLVDKLSYGGETYLYLTFPGDIFYYDLCGPVECEEDEVVPIAHDKWKLAYREGDLFVLQSQWEDACRYYSQDAHYDWYVMVEDPETEEATAVPIQVTDQDREYIYAMESRKGQTTLFFEDIERFGSLVKLDKEGLIRASAILAYHQGNWYWRSQTIDDKVEGWPEYVVELPQGIVKQLRQIP